MTIQNDSTLAAQANAPKRLAILGEIENKQVGARNSLLKGLAMTVTLGVTSKEEVAKGWPSCNSPNVYAADFNRGHKASQVIGEAAALALIADAAKKPGVVYDIARAALKLVMDEGAKRAKAGQTGMVSPKAAAKLVSSSLSAAGRKLAAAKATKKDGGKAGGKKPDAPKPELTAAQFVSDLRALLAAGAKLSAPEGREAAWGIGMNDARKALENFSVATAKK